MGNVAGAALGAVGSLSGSGGTQSQSQGSTNTQGTQNTTQIQRPSTYSPSDAGFAAQIPIFQGAGAQAVNSITSGDNANQAQLAPLIQTSYGAMDSLMDSMGIARPAEGSYTKATNLAQDSAYALANNPQTLSTNLQAVDTARMPVSGSYGDTTLLTGLEQGNSLPLAQQAAYFANMDQAGINWDSNWLPTAANMSPKAIGSSPNTQYTAGATDPWSAWNPAHSPNLTNPALAPFDGTTYPATGYAGNFTGQGQGANAAVNFAGAGLNTGLGQPANSGFGAVPDNYQPTPTPYGILPGQTSLPFASSVGNPQYPAQYVAPNLAQLNNMYQQNQTHVTQNAPLDLQAEQALNSYNAALAMPDPTDNTKQTNAANQSANVQAQLASDPNYQFQMQQGLKAINAQAAASGYNLSPAAAQQLSTFAQGQASSAMTSYRNQLSSIMNQGLQGVQMSQASTTNAANAAATSYTNTGTQVAGSTANATSNWQVGPITQQSI